MLNYDCRYFLGDRPCVYHKEYGSKCKDCKYYQPVKKRILIIKLGAIGDVLRTTSILRGLKNKYKDSHISWLVSKNAYGILKGNPYIDKILIYDFELLPFLQIKEFGLLINLDVSLDSCSLAAIVRAGEKRGFGLGREGQINCFNRAAKIWLEMSLFDDLKKANKRTYPEIMSSVVGIKPEKYEMILELSPEELTFAEEFIRKKNLSNAPYIIGLSTGAGSRWPLKKWTVDGYGALISKISQGLNKDLRLLLFGGPREKERNEKLISMFPDALIDTGPDNSLRQFAALVNKCDLMICGDTLAMHIATAFKKNTVVLFGPTSSAEIDLYARGEKILPTMDCLCCYKNTCHKHPNCMENINVDLVFEAVKRFYNARKRKT